MAIFNSYVKLPEGRPWTEIVFGGNESSKAYLVYLIYWRVILESVAISIGICTKQLRIRFVAGYPRLATIWGLSKAYNVDIVGINDNNGD